MGPLICGFLKINTVNVDSLLSNTFFPLAYFIVIIQYRTHTIYKYVLIDCVIIGKALGRQ